MNMQKQFSPALTERNSLIIVLSKCEGISSSYSFSLKRNVKALDIGRQEGCKKYIYLEGYTAKANQETTCFIFIIIFKVH